jgi:hypothetical protein
VSQSRRSAALAGGASHGQHALHEPAATIAVRTEGHSSPEDGLPDAPLRVVVRPIPQDFQPLPDFVLDGFGEVDQLLAADLTPFELPRDWWDLNACKSSNTIRESITF